MQYESIETRPFISIVSIATDRYLFFWEEMVKSFYSNCEFLSDCQWVLLTNREQDIDPEIRALLGKNLTIAYIEHSSWPLPTLLRYKYIGTIRDLILGSRILYIDADMKAVAKISRVQIIDFFDSNRITFVKHPGYFRQEIFFVPFNLKQSIRDLVLRIRFGGIGNWETNINSQAYVKRRSRRHYLCGGIWGGPTELVIKFVDLLDQRTDTDIRNGVMAKFHDESHLNWFVANHDCNIEPPIWCFEPTYRNLKGLKPFIEAVNKNSTESWTR